jgi:hypothetical protein
LQLSVHIQPAKWTGVVSLGNARPHPDNDEARYAAFEQLAATEDVLGFLF